MKSLSSSWTFFHKFVFPAIWIGLFGFGTATLLIEHSAEAPIFFGVFTVGAVVLYWLGVRLKKVSLRGDTFVISNFRREILVPISNLERAGGSVMINPEVVWLHFKRETEFGNKVLFMPRHRWFRGFSRHPVVEELNQLTRRTKFYGA